MLLILLTLLALLVSLILPVLPILPALLAPLVLPIPPTTLQQCAKIYITSNLLSLSPLLAIYH